MDLGIIFGLLGIAAAILSALYARAQAVEARRQAETARLAATAQVTRSLSETLLEARMGIVNTPLVLKEYLEANPQLAALYQDPAKLQAFIHLRNYMDALQDLYFLRKEGVAASYQWRGWLAALVPIARMPTFRAISENAVSRQAVEPEFATFLAEILAERPAPDPYRGAGAQGPG